MESAYRKVARHLEPLIYVEPRAREAREAIGLSAMQSLLKLLGNPESELAIIHIAGSKGKGSTALIGEAILRSAGLSTGTFTSPHLERWTERIRVNGLAVDAEKLADALDAISPCIEMLRASDPANPPTFFEVLTAVGFLLFREARVDWVLLEAGIGGRLDATNVVRPRAACITSIELEHMDRLGDSIQSIAREKAGIAKPGVPLVIGPVSREARATITREARTRGATVIAPPSDYSITFEAANHGNSRLEIRSDKFRVSSRFSRPSHTLAWNAGIAVMTLDAAAALPRNDLIKACTRALESVELPARCELIATVPAVLVDSAHTEASALALSDMIRMLGLRPVHMVISMSAKRNLEPVCRIIGNIAERVTATRAESTRSLAPESIAATLRTLHPDRVVEVCADPYAAVRSAHKTLPRSGLLCVAGSVYLAGLARSMFSGGR